MTTKEAADQLGVKINWIQKLIQSKRIKAQKVGRDYWIEQADLDVYKKDKRPVGRPKIAS